MEEFNGPQGRILYVLWQQDCVPIVRLARQTGLAKNTLTSMLARMESAGLVNRKSAGTDRRQVLVSLTDKARSLEDQYKQVSQQMNALFYQGMTQADADQLDALLDRVLLNLTDCEKELKQGSKKKTGKEDSHDKKEG